MTAPLLIALWTTPTRRTKHDDPGPDSAGAEGPWGFDFRITHVKLSGGSSRDIGAHLRNSGCSNQFRDHRIVLLRVGRTPKSSNSCSGSQESAARLGNLLVDFGQHLDGELRPKLVEHSQWPNLAKFDQFRSNFADVSSTWANSLPRWANLGRIWANSRLSEHLSGSSNFSATDGVVAKAVHRVDDHGPVVGAGCQRIVYRGFPLVWLSDLVRRDFEPSR